VGMHFGFTSGVLPRVGLALGWAAIAFGVVMLLDADSARRAVSPATRTASPPAVSMDEEVVELRLDAGFRVTQWRVSVGTREIEPDSHDASSWSAQIPTSGVAGRFEILLEAQSEDLFADHRHALRVRLRDDERQVERTIWDDGDVTVLVDVAGWLQEAP